MSLGKLEQLEARIAKLERWNEMRLALQFDGVPVPGTDLTLQGGGDGFAHVEDERSKPSRHSNNSPFRADILANPVLVTAVKQTMRECGLRNVQALRGSIELSAEELCEEPAAPAARPPEHIARRFVPVASVPGFYLKVEHGLIQPTATLFSSLDGGPTLQEARCPSVQDAIFAIKAVARSLGVERVRCVNAVLGVSQIKREQP